jgi:hypothetical protein
MIWSKQHLQSLDEHTLSTRLLVPLFEAMGFQNVTFHHGGILEQGKDLVMWRAEIPRDRVNYAVVVKADRIAGTVASTGAVYTQVKQSFGAPYIDKKTHEEVIINHCFVVSSAEIQKEGTNPLKSLLSADHLTDRVTMIDGDELLKLLEQYLPQSMILLTLRESYEKLPKVPHSCFQITVTKEGASITVLPETASSPRLNLNLMPVFRDTSEGQQKKKEYEAFLNSGEPVEFDQKSLESIRLPAFMAPFLPADLTSMQVKLGPTDAVRQMLYALELKTSDGESFELPYLHFSTIRGGSQEVTISNEQQPIPLKISLIAKKGRAGRFSYEAHLAGKGIHWLVKSMQFERILAKGPAVYLLDLESGLRDHFTTLKRGVIVPPDKKLLELAQRVERIQKLTKTAITVPDRVFFNVEDYNNILLVEHVLERGCYPADVNSCSMTFSKEELHKARSSLLEEPINRLSFRQTCQYQKILDTLVPLGPIEVMCETVRMIDADREKVEAMVSGRSKEEEVTITLIPQGENKINVRFLQWPMQK